jgi:uncharacterized Ntn-hydrolase superfamily protein
MLRRTLLPLLGLSFLASRPSATWSIVCVNTRTREVGVASATCLENFNLRTGVPVIFVGEGAAAAQSFLDVSGENRRLIYFSYRDLSETPAEILVRLDDLDLGHQTRQYGIVNFEGPPVTFTGNRAGAAATGVTGEIGELLYAIQGNVLTGDEVVFAAEAAFRTQKGDMAEKMMAAMEAARVLGGDGRCSCNSARPTSCGVPPPSFEKSAHVGVVVLARVGDVNGGCNANRGCADGTYYLNLNVIDGAGDPDPVKTLQQRYFLWRERLKGRPDGLFSRVQGAKPLPADGTTERTLVLELRDIEEGALTRGGAVVQITTVGGVPSNAQIGPVTDLGNGRYSFPVRAGAVPGLDRFSIKVTDALPANPADVVVATLYPPLEIVTSEQALYVGEDALSAALGERVPFVVNRADKAGAAYTLVARLAASERRLPRALLPRGDELLGIPHSPFFPAAPLRLDGRGRAEAALDVPPGALERLIGRRVEVTGFVLDGGPLESTNPAGFEVRP